VPALRRLTFFRRPEPYLAVVLVVLALAAVDSLRPAQSQVTARLYIATVRGYQRWGRPVTSQFVRCPYRPTCSEYSRQAVEKFGLPRGLVLTVGRLARCRGGVPQGTPDPIP
jgi:putative component of membrane protein insertase Oxa1/YidC/SpoIIIJ protein YidD